MNLGHLYFDIVSDFVLHISAFSMPDNSLPNMKIRPTTNYQLPITNYHGASGMLYNCRDIFTHVVSALQIHLFMQNKAKFKKVKLSVNRVLTRNYEQMDTWSIRTKQSQTNPTCRGEASGEAGNKPNLSRRSLWRSRIQTQYKPNTNPIQSQFILS